MASALIPPYPRSDLIAAVLFSKYRFHKGDGDMWPITWADDDNMYGGAGDNMGSPMNFWKITMSNRDLMPTVSLINNRPVDHRAYCRIVGQEKPNSIKPAGLLHVDGVMYFAVESQNYGDNPEFNRQHNTNGWIVTSSDYGVSWDCGATPTDFLTGRLASCHFLQFGKSYDGARDEFVYAYFPGVGDDGNSYWENGDCILLGRVPRDSILTRDAWEFYVAVDESNVPSWSADDTKAAAVFRYPLMTGEDHVSYNAGIKRYILGNYGFHDGKGNPFPHHQMAYPHIDDDGNMTENIAAEHSQLALFEAPEPWGPWSLFFKQDCWGQFGIYQPCFPTKLMCADGLRMAMVSSGTYDDYNLTMQRLELRISDRG